MSAVAPGRLRASCRVLSILVLTLLGVVRVAHPADDGLAPLRALGAADRARLEAKAPKTQEESHYLEMSPMGALARGLATPRDPDRVAGASPMGRLQALPGSIRSLAVGGTDIVVHGNGDAGLQSETSIASNADATVLIAGYNDARGFAASPVSLSGVARSTDGGATWNEVAVGPGGLGVLPSVTGGQVFGDPDVKFDPTRNCFVYSSIYVRPSDGRQGMCIHYSNADGSSWTGPIEVTPSFVANQSADKEFIDIEPTTGRILMTWTMFSVTPTRIVGAYSDDLGTSWSTLKTIYTSPSGGGAQASVPRWAGDGTTAYVTWRTSAPATGARNIGFAKSVNGGDTWTTTTSITVDYTSEDQILGIDRVNTSPGMAVDQTNGNIYIVYQANNSVGEGDVALQVSANAGGSFTPRALINSDPGNDRAQFYPSVAVDQSTGRVHAIWYDQDPQASGDLTEFMHSFSDDGGTTWSRPTPLFDHPFRAGFGNDTSQPNVGDYLQAVAVGGVLHSLAASNSEVVLYDEGQPANASLFSPDAYYDQLPEATAAASLRLGTVSIAEPCPAGADGNVDPGETVELTMPVENYVMNATASPTTYTDVVGTLTAITPGVTILDPVQAYPDAPPLGIVANASPFRLRLDPGFIPGTAVQLLLEVATSLGSIQLPYRLPTGTPGTPVVLIDENFDGVVAPSLPAGWAFSNAGGSATPAWVTANTIPGGGIGSNMAFHSNSTSFKWHRLFSPVVVVPSGSPGNEGYVTLDFDLAVSTEDEPSRLVQAYDGLTVRITDQTAGSTLRSVLAEAFAERLETGTIHHFPKHLPRSSSTSYLEDMSVWSGYSAGFVHVSMKFPGEGLYGRSIQLRFEYAEDGSANCASNGYPTPCGVGIDNLVLQFVPTTTTFALVATTNALDSDVNPADPGEVVNLAATVAPSTATGTVEFLEGATSLGTAPLVAGVATLPISTLTTGSHVLHAVFEGDACHAGSTSDDFIQDINAVAAVEPGAPASFAITHVVPNPTLGATRVGLAMPREARVSLAILDVQGREVAMLADGPLGAGLHELAWNGRVGHEPAPAGIYFVRLRVAGTTQVRRLAVAR